MIEALEINVKGIVQGVGFRPFVYRLAKRYLISGWVLNAIDGVFIHAEGEGAHLDEFVMEISDSAPAAARVERITMKEVPLLGCTGFEIRFSDDAQTKETTLVSPDLATCDECVSELFDPANRRYRYPFINCTNCGPRFTIIDALPYDRASTSMGVFEMCPACAHEYADPEDRRFHAQPDACFECGPHVSWCEKDKAGALGPVSWGSTREESDAIFARAAQLLLQGKILAVKGLGGFHLVCDAANPQALANLRARKHRDGKAFAVMVALADDASAACEVSVAERQQLELPERPIVLLRKKPGVQLAQGLADRLPELGVMLPATPVQHLLLHDFAQARAAAGASAGASAAEGAATADAVAAGTVAADLVATGAADAGLPPMVVMTSGNVHDEPIVTSDERAYADLAGIADAFLGNNREIRARYDDSVVRVLRVGGVDEAGSPNTAVQFIRRARGFAPAPLVDPSRSEDAPCVVAAGSEQKNTFALTRGRQTFVSQHIGDMENADVYDAWLESKARFEKLFELKPQLAACDKHPEYFASKWAHESGLPVTQVQHHHAHIASVMGEHGITDAVCGVAFDGTGYGEDGAIWGGEVLLANRQTFERFANFAYVPMPGGAAAIKRPLRMAYGVLWAFDLLGHPGASDAVAALGDEAPICDQMIERGLNTPLTSSVGRLFDAAAALLGICVAPTYEGEPAIMIDAARAATDTLASRENGAVSGETSEEVAQRYAIGIQKNAATAESTALDTSVLLLDPAPTFKAMLDDKVAGVPASIIALRFHNAFVDAVVTVAQLANALYGISTVALSGGVFMNRYLAEQCTQRLGAAGFTVALNKDLPPNDGCISYGQAVVACARSVSEGIKP